MPNDRAGQRRIISDGLKAAAAMTEPGSIHDLPFRFVDDDWKAEPMSWLRILASSRMFRAVMASILACTRALNHDRARQASNRKTSRA